MDTYRMTENPTTGELQPTSVWKTPRFQMFAAIVVGTALLLSLVAVFNLKAPVDNLTQKKIPYIETQVDKLPAR